MVQYTGLYGMDLTPEEVEAGFLDISQAQGTPTYKIPEFDRYSYAPRHYGALPSMYELYLSGGFPTAEVAQDTPVDTGGGGGGSGATLPGFDVDSPKNTLADIDTGAVAAMTDNLAYTGGDTTMPPMLDPTGQMGAESFVDTTPDYSNVGLTSPKRPGQDIVTRAEPVNLIEQDIGSQHPMAKEAVGTTPPDTIGPQPVNIVEPDIGSQHPLNLMSAKVPPAVETVPGPFDYLQPEETFQE